MTDPYYWRPKDLADMLECSMSKAYKLLQQFNKELSSQGYVTIAGRVPKQYAIDRLGLEARGIGQRENHQGTENHTRRSAGIFRGRNHVGLSM